VSGVRGADGRADKGRSLVTPDTSKSRGLMARWRRLALVAIRFGAAGCATTTAILLTLHTMAIVNHMLFRGWVTVSNNAPPTRASIWSGAYWGARRIEWADVIMWGAGCLLLWIFQRRIVRFVLADPPSPCIARRTPIVLGALLRAGVVACGAAALTIAANELIRTIEWAGSNYWFVPSVVRAPSRSPQPFADALVNRLRRPALTRAAAWGVATFALWLIQRNLDRLLSPLQGNLCPTCGYDFGSTPAEKCPECGTPAHCVRAKEAPASD
jgi:hypothetical protein